MSTGLICPNCSTATTFHRPPVSECPQCHQPYPDALRLSAEASLARQRATRPLLLTLGMFGSGFFAIIWLILLALALFDIGSSSIAGVSVSGPEFLRQVGLPMVALALSWAAIAYGLARERAWARLLMIGSVVILDVFLIAEAIKNPQSDSDLSTAIIWSIAYLGFAAWYLYGRQSVTDYYKALEAEEAASGAEPTASSSHK